MERNVYVLPKQDNLDVRHPDDTLMTSHDNANYPSENLTLTDRTVDLHFTLSMSCRSLELSCLAFRWLSLAQADPLIYNLKKNYPLKPPDTS